MPRFTTLYSGSSGNCGVLEEDGRFLLFDMGGSCRATVNGLRAMGLELDGLLGICVTHEHSDHIKGLNVFLKKYPVPIYASLATIDALWHMDAVPETTELIALNDHIEDIGGFIVKGFPGSHDAAGCYGYRVTTPSGRVLALATDLGVVTVDIYENLRGAHLVALESNYDQMMLRTGPYPAMLKHRVGGKYGHLCNDMAAATMIRLWNEGCTKFTFLHLSNENNTPGEVRRTMDAALFEAGIQKCDGHVLQVASRYEPSPWIEF